ncbi:MAG: hypothetical protein LBG52_07735 [Candidatus Peribacteria bacterium]|jgi:hypothetical protein|nr:hypothetical protein [Candidatus Peribacteria bacterium]
MKNVVLLGLVALPFLTLTGCGTPPEPTLNNDELNALSGGEDGFVDVTTVEPITPTVSPAVTYTAADGTTFSLVVVTNDNLSVANFYLNDTNYSLPQVETLEGILFADYGDGGEGTSLALNGDEAIFTEGGVSTTYTSSLPASLDTGEIVGAE